MYLWEELIGNSGSVDNKHVFAHLGNVIGYEEKVNISILLVGVASQQLEKHLWEELINYSESKDNKHAFVHLLWCDLNMHQN